LSPNTKVDVSQSVSQSVCQSVSQCQSVSVSQSVNQYNSGSLAHTKEMTLRRGKRKKHDNAQQKGQSIQTYKHPWCRSLCSFHKRSVSIRLYAVWVSGGEAPQRVA